MYDDVYIYIYIDLLIYLFIYVRVGVSKKQDMLLPVGFYMVAFSNSAQ